MRARNIKPGLFKNEVLGVEDPLLTILYTGLWCMADKAGRMEDRPLRIKAEIFPYREIPDFNGYLTELERLEFICRYSAGNKRYIQVLNFSKHQNPHKTEKASEIPPPSETQLKTDSCSLTDKEPLNNGELTEAARLIPDSLIPDSLIPDSSKNTMSGKPDRDPPAIKIHKQEAKEILNFLNQKTGKAYRPVDANLEMIMARLKEGYEPDCFRQVIAKKCREWSEKDSMAEYLRPKTLFNKTNFAQYTGELVPVEVAHG